MAAIMGRARYVVFALTILQSFLTSGTVFGWPAVVLLLKREGQFAELCDNTTLTSNEATSGECEARTLTFLTIFQAGLFSTFAARLGFGILLDRIGPRYTASIGVIFIIIGAIIFGLSDSHTLPAFWVGMLLIGFGSPATHVCGIHVSNLFDKGKRTIISAYSATFSVSGLIFLIMAQLNESFDWSVRQLFLGYAVLLVFVLLTVLVVQPRRIFKKGQELTFNLSRGGFVISDRAEESASSNLTLTDHLSEEALELANVEKTENSKQQLPVPSTPSLFKQAFSVEFLLLTIFVVAVLTQLQFFVATVSAQVVLLGDGESTNFLYAKSFNIIAAVAPVSLPLLSFVLERHGFAVSFAVLTLFSMLTNAFAIAPVLPVQMVTFIFWSLCRFFLFSTYFAYLPETFGFANFGVLNGILSCFMAISALLPYPLTALVLNVFDGQYKYIHISFIFVSVLCFAYPIWLWRRANKPSPSNEVSSSTTNQTYMRVEDTEPNGVIDEDEQL